MWIWEARVRVVGVRGQTKGCGRGQQKWMTISQRGIFDGRDVERCIRVTKVL